MAELTWTGKYDANGRKVAPLRLKLPFQTLETVNESAQERQMTLDMFTAGRPLEWRNRLMVWDFKIVHKAEYESLHPQDFEDLIALEPVGFM